MHKSRSVVTGLLVIILFLNASGPMAASGSGGGAGLLFRTPEPSGLAQAVSVPTATLRAASGAAITFVTQNGQTVGEVPPQALELPHLVLDRNGTLTESDERTLIVEVIGIDVPPDGVTVTLKVESQHGDPDLGGGSDNRIPVWDESQRIANTLGVTHTGVTAVFVHEFDATVISGTERMPTPTDYFRYDITVLGTNHSVANPLHAFSEDYAFLMENQWIAPLPEVQEESAGAAPDELIVYYCDMFPFQKSIHDPTTWLPRRDVTAYVGSELVPQMVEAFRIQTDEWGFTWYHAWTSYRSGKDAERLSVALADGQTWFHGEAPSRGNSRMSIKVKGGDNARYDTLTDGLMSTFHHELFHNLQRNINLHNGGSGDVGGAEGAWQFFSEGTAVLASSVGQPAVQFAPTSALRAFMAHARNFVRGDGTVGDLNRSYERMSPYHAAIYWRFLYEQCGGMKDGVEDSGAGMEVIRRALTELYSGKAIGVAQKLPRILSRIFPAKSTKLKMDDSIDISSSTDLIGTVPEIMDRALEGSSCPFKTYEDSLVAFAGAIYGLQLDGGRCIEPGTPAGCGLYDPHHLYHGPSRNTITFAGADQEYQEGIGSSFGVDFVEVILDPAADGQPLTLEFFGAPGAGAEFDVQLWKLLDPGGGARPQRIPTPTIAPESLTRVNADGRQFYVVPAIDTSVHNRLGLIITRLDAKENSDPIGEYTVVLRPDGDDGWQR
jgi:hypothetical protein